MKMMKREMDKKYSYVLSFENPLPSGLANLPVHSVL